MRTADNYLDDYAIRRYVTMLHINRQIRQRRHEFGVIRSDSVEPKTMVSPGLVIVMRAVAERRHHRIEIVTVLTPNMVFYHCLAGVQTFCLDLIHSAPPRSSTQYRHAVASGRHCKPRPRYAMTTRRYRVTVLTR